MTEREFRDTLRLLDSATHLLGRHDIAPRAALIRELRQLALELDLLRLALRQSPVESQRN